MMEDSSKNKFVCKDCFVRKKCRESAVTWIFFFIALIATISVRAVNIALSFNPGLAKVFWYTGVIGFSLFFIYKFRNYNILHRELERSNLSPKLLSKQPLSDQDYEILGTVLCQLRSKKDKTNFLFIFLFSGLALLLAIYVDFIK